MSEEPPRTRPRWVKPVLLTVLVVVSVWVLFTWVFPWVTEMGLSPALD